MVPGYRITNPRRGFSGGLGGGCIGRFGLAVAGCYCMPAGYYLVWPGDKPVRVALLPGLVTA